MSWMTVLSGSSGVYSSFFRISFHFMFRRPAISVLTGNILKFACVMIRRWVSMVFCSGCGKELPEGAFFCPNCGVRIRRETEACGPWDEVSEAFERMGERLEKTFERVGREIERAFEGVGEELVVCPDCGIENVAGAKFCHECGKKLE